MRIDDLVLTESQQAELYEEVRLAKTRYEESIRMYQNGSVADRRFNEFIMQYWKGAYESALRLFETVTGNEWNECPTYREYLEMLDESGYDDEIDFYYDDHEQMEEAEYVLSDY